jgi:hypothetical protein
MNTQSTLGRQTLDDFLLGMTLGMVMDTFIPKETDGTYLNTFTDGVQLSLILQWFPYSSHAERAARSISVCTGAIVGQTLYRVGKLYVTGII